MKLSCLCLTYGRPSQLNEAVACFMAQSYADKELIIFNTLPEQKIAFNHPNVRIFNCDQRPESLGMCRNFAAEMATGDVLVTWDDDDLYTSEHLANFAQHFKPGIDWVMQPTQFFSERGRIKNVVRGSFNVVAFTKKAWKATGYPQSNVGEDRQFVSRLTTDFQGYRIPIENFTPSFIYAWGQGTVYHVSGLGEDRPGKPTAWERAGQDMAQKLKSGAVKRGVIHLKPGLRLDYDKEASTFLTKNAPENFKGKAPVCIVMLGKYGDVCNVLPIAKLIAERYDKPHFMVSHKFSSILDGVSYVIPHSVPLDFKDGGHALKLAAKTYPIVVNAHWMAGRNRQTTAFNRESWRNAGFDHLFEDKTLRPVFDRRNLAREEALCNKLLIGGKKPLLMAIKGGVSSPFPMADGMIKMVQKWYGDHFHLIDLSLVRAERIYDVLGLMDRAAGLIACDSAMLHLAAASNVPTVALTNPQPWLGTLPRGNCVRRLTYDEALADPERIIDAVAATVAAKPN